MMTSWAGRIPVRAIGDTGDNHRSEQHEKRRHDAEAAFPSFVHSGSFPRTRRRDGRTESSIRWSQLE